MTNEIAVQEPSVHDLDPKVLESLVVNGDCSKLTPEQRVAYYRSRCEVAGLDYRAQPFQFLMLNGKLVLYAVKGATDQLAANHGIVCEIVDQRTENDIRTVTVRSRTKDGRQTDEIGCVSVKNKTGDDLCNAFMKSVTKAKRRAVLSLCGLGMLDETELETIPASAKAPAVSLTTETRPGLPPAPDKSPEAMVDSVNKMLAGPVTPPPTPAPPAPIIPPTPPVAGHVEGGIQEMKKGNGKRMGIKINGTWYGTFSETVAKEADRAMNAALVVEIDYETTTKDGKTYQNITKLTAIEPMDGEGCSDKIEDGPGSEVA